MSRFRVTEVTDVSIPFADLASGEYRLYFSSDNASFAVKDDAGVVTYLSGLSTEGAQDVVGTMLTASEATGDLDWTYDDVGNALYASVKSDSITFAKLQNIDGFSVIGKSTTGSGDADEIIAGADTVLGRSGSGDLIFGTIVTNQIGADQVTNAKLANAAANTFKANATTGSDNPTDVAVAASQFVGRTAASDLKGMSVTEATALLNAATTSLKGLQSSADKLKEDNMWVDVVAEFGADPTGVANSTTPIQNAIDSFTSAGGILFFPNGTYSVNATLTIDVPIMVLGQGRANTNIRTSHATADVFDMVTGSQGAGFEQIRISATNSTTRTGGYGVDMTTISDITMFKCDILYMHTGIHMGGALQNIEDINIRECGLGANNGQNILVDGFGDRRISKVVIDNGSDPTGHAGIRVRRCSSLLISDSNIVNATNCLDVVPNGGGGTEAASVYAINTFFDSSVIGANIVPASNSDTIQRMTFVRCWFGTHSQAGVVLGNASINVANTSKVDFIACEFYQSPFGIDCLGVAEWSVRASRFAGNTTNAIRTAQGAQAGVHNFSITDNFIGAAGSFGANAQGINIQSGTYGRYQVIDNRGLDTNTTAGMIDAGTATNSQKNVFNNMGYNAIASNIGADVSFTTSEILLLQCRVPAGTRNIGETFRVRICGTGPIAAGNITIRLKVDANDGTTAGTVLLTLPAITGVVNGRWGLDAQVVLKTATSVRGEGYGYSNTAIIHPTAAAPPAATAVTTTAPFFIKVTGQMSASTSIATTGSITPLG